MTTAVSFLAAILIVQGSLAEEKKPWKVNRLCGRVEYVEKVSDRKNPNNYSEKRKGSKALALALYESKSETLCCDNLNRVDTTTSGRGGQFKFRPTKDGHYWLTALWNGTVYKQSVTVGLPISAAECSEQGISLDGKGKASWWVTVTVD